MKIFNSIKPGTHLNRERETIQYAILLPVHASEQGKVISVIRTSPSSYFVF